MTRIFIIGIPFLIAILFIGCAASDPILATIGDENISLRSFEDNFSRNNGGWDSSAVSSLEDRQEFLDLLIKFRLKVKEANSRGLDKDSAVISEMDSYNTAITQTLMLEKEVIEPGVKEYYNRKKEEVRASHILFNLQRNAAPEDTVKTYIYAMNIIDQIPQISFDTLAVRYSEDPSAKTNNGDLGFFSAGRMIPEFEDACYSLKPGEHTKKPIRTHYGYHIIKMKDKRPSSGSIRLSHILLKFNNTSSDTVAVRDTAWMLYKQLKDGASFKELVVKYSQDPQTVSKDGDLGFFERERIVPVIADILYKLKIDSVSEPVGFKYGYHIFRLTEKKGLPSFEELEKDIKKQYQQTRYQNDYKNYVKLLRTRYHVLIDSSVVNLLISNIDTTKTAGNEDWKDTLSSEILKTTLLRCADRQLQVRDFVEKAAALNEYRNHQLISTNVWLLANKIADNAALEQHARYFEKTDPVISQIMKEYKEGTLLYRIEQDEVWGKVVVNDSLLKEYYNSHMDDYRWPERVNFAEIYTTSDSIAKAVYKKIKGGMDFLDAAKEYTDRSGYREQKGVWGFQVFALNDLSLKASKMAVDSITAPFRFEKGWSIIKVLGRDSAHVKTFEEAIPEITSAYQEEASKQREQEWVDSLKKKYPVIVNKEILTNAFKNKRVEAR